jgi:GT2 family glycosyltransferase
MVTFSARNADPAYSLVTVNYRSASSIGRMFRSLPADFSLKGEFIIVNNDVSEEDFLERMFRGIEFVRIINMGSNFGFSYACNRGAEIGRGIILFFLNPDTRLLSVSLEPVFQECLGDDRVIVAPRLSQDDRDEPWSSGGTVSPGRILLQNMLPFSSFWAFLSDKSLSWVSGAAFALRKQDFDFLGGFDEGYFLYYEDVDLCRRAKELGFRIQRNKSVVFLHHGGRSHAEETGKQKKAYFHSQDRYIRKHYGPFWRWLFRILRVFRSFFLLKLC